MERLTGRNEKGDLLLMGEQVYAGDYYEAVSALEKYEDAEENGSLIRPPCSVGDTVFALYWNRKSERYDTRKGMVRTARYDLQDRLWTVSDGERFSEWGKNIFPTLEEAEAALASLEETE